MEWPHAIQHEDARSLPEIETFSVFSADPYETTRALSRAAAQFGDVLCTHIWIHDATTRTYRQIAWHGVARSVSDPVPETREPFSTAVTSKRSVLLQATDRDSSVHAHSWRFAIPVWADADHGVAVVDFAGRQPDNKELARLSVSYSARVGASISVHIARHEAACAAALLRAGSVLSSVVDPAVAADILLERAMSLTGAHTGSILLRSEGESTLRIIASKGLPADIVRSTEVREGEGVAGWVLATGKPLTIEDLPTRGPQGRRHGVRSSLSVPIRDESEIIGVLSVGSRTFPGHTLGPVLDALQALAELGSVAMLRAKAFVSTRRMYFETVQALVMALETKDPFSHGSTDRVVDITTSLGRAMSLSEADAEALRIASLLHDIGMNAAGEVVAVSGRPLSTVEHTLLKMHPVIAADILRQAPTLEMVVPIVYHHHERYDGTGYMTGLSGDLIPLGARILAVADAYVAMTSDRPYRRALSAEDALHELQRHAGSQFDPAVVEAFSHMHSSKNERPPRRTAVEETL